jgi:glycosyltransferase involved in cell wall biosynthesis
MRLCFFTPNFLPAVGGTEVVTDALARQWHALGHEVTVLAPAPEHALDLPYRVAWYRRPTLPRLFPERIGAALRTLHHQLRFDVLVANYGAPTGYAAIKLGQQTRTPAVVISHGGDLYLSSGDRQRPHLWKRTVWAYQHADALVAISPYIETLIRQIHANPRLLVRIPNGIDVAGFDRPAPRPADFADTRPFALCLGNLGPMKGFDDAIAAFAAVRQQMADTVLVVVGSGKLDGPLRQQAGELKLGDRIHFMGQRTGDDKRWFLQNAAFGLMPSIEEGHPVVGLEFLACGRPIVCSTNAAFDGMYDDGVNAYRVPAQDRAALAQAMAKMQRADRVAMGAQSRRRADAYDWPVIARRYLDLFEQLLPVRSATP